MTPKDSRIVSGMRPTGKLHLGHYHGVLKNWVRLQQESECFFFIADLHALTTEYAAPQMIRESIREILADWLAVGLDPNRATLFVQSAVPAHSELHLLLSMITPLGWLERVPSYKEMQREFAEKDLSTYGFLGYPLLQAADILLYDGNKVPVGIDQVPHIELVREIVRRFNHLYGKTLVEPQPLLTEAPKLIGFDRRKMSKSYDNCIYLSDSPEEVSRKVMSAITDPARMKREDPGNPDVCLIFDYHQLHSDAETIHRVDRECRRAEIGCVEDKKMMVKTLNDFLQPIREKRAKLLGQPNDLEAIIAQGNHRATEVAEQTLARVRRAMKL